MKNWKKLMSGFLSVAALALIVVSISSCNDDDDTPQPTQSIVALAQAQPNLSSLVAALTKFPDLVSTLSGTGNFTVFAPTNDAFSALLTTVGQTSIDDVPEDVLKSLLQYHVVTSGAVLSTQLQAGNVATGNGENVAVTISGGIRLNGSTQVLTADVLAVNGVVHIVDQVLVPTSIGKFVNTIVEPAYFNKNFTTLIAAVNAASPEILTALLAPTPKKTLFAPTNEAFVAAGITTLPGRDELNAVLRYHVLTTEIRANQLPTNTAPGNTEVETLSGKFYLSNRGTTGVFINGSTKVTPADIVATNGVVHVIDRTLRPPSQTIGQVVTALTQASQPQFTQLLAALNRVTSLRDATLDATQKLTVFAPTDAAFEALYDALEVNGINDIEIGLLTAVLQHHIVSAPTTATGRVFSRDLINGAVDTLLEESQVTISATNGTVTSSGGTVAQLSSTPALLNVLGTNGVIHTINAVLVPGN